MKLDWFCQVWVHCDIARMVSVVGTWKTEWQAQKDTDCRNTAVRIDMNPDDLPRLFYFVRPILADELKAEMAERYKRELLEDTEFFMSQYRGEFKPYARNMVQCMISSIESRNGRDHFMLDERGRWLDGYNVKYDSDCKKTCSALYSGVEKESLGVAFVRGGCKDATFVGVFNDEAELIRWLRDRETAVDTCGAELIEICCDRHRGLH